MRGGAVFVASVGLRVSVKAEMQHKPDFNISATPAFSVNLT